MHARLCALIVTTYVFNLLHLVDRRTIVSFSALIGIDVRDCKRLVTGCLFLLPFGRPLRCVLFSAIGVVAGSEFTNVDLVACSGGELSCVVGVDSCELKCDVKVVTAGLFGWSGFSLRMWHRVSRSRCTVSRLARSLYKCLTSYVVSPKRLRITNGPSRLFCSALLLFF